MIDLAKIATPEFYTQIRPGKASEQRFNDFGYELNEFIELLSYSPEIDEILTLFNKLVLLAESLGENPSEVECFRQQVKDSCGLAILHAISFDDFESDSDQLCGLSPMRLVN